MDKSEAVVITGEARIEGARWLAVRGALKLETRGLKRRGTSARVLANEITGSKARTSVEAYKALNQFITDNLGEQFDSPLNQDKR